MRHYDLKIEAAGFKTEKKTRFPAETEAARKVAVGLELGRQSEVNLLRCL